MQSGNFDCDALTRECPTGYAKICEGTAAVLIPHTFINKQTSAKMNVECESKPVAVNKCVTACNDDDNSAQSVFYNPAQVVNRDLSICVIEAFSRILQQEPQRKRQRYCHEVAHSFVSANSIDTKENSKINDRTSSTIEKITKANGITILEALSATGLRAIRYYKEISHVRYIIANDLDTDAVDCIANNCDYNHIPRVVPSLSCNAARVVNVTEQDNHNTYCVESHDATSNSGDKGIKKETSEEKCHSVNRACEPRGIIVNVDDANDLMHRLAVNSNVHHNKRLCLITTCTEEHKKEEEDEEEEHEENDKLHLTGTSERRSTFVPLLQQELMDVVDLDPYGSAAPFLDAAFRCIKEGGLMLITSTDSAILCGNYMSTCHGKYNSVPYKSTHCHEMAVRILLAALERVANKHKKYIVPLLSLHIDFYVRCFVRVYTQPAAVKLSSVKLGYLMQCTHCPAFWLRPLITAQPPRSRSHKRSRKVQNEVATENESENVNRIDEYNNKVITKEETFKATESFATIPHAAATLSVVHESNFIHSDMKSNANANKKVKLPVEEYPTIPSHHDNWRASCTTMQELQLHRRNQSGETYEQEQEEEEEEQETITHNVCNAVSCPVCGSNIAISGPIYAAPTQNVEFLNHVLEVIAERSPHQQKSTTTSTNSTTFMTTTLSTDTGKGIHEHAKESVLPLAAFARIRGLVLTARDELPRCPLFYDIQSLASYVRVRCIPTPLLVGALARLGYQCSQVHCCASGLKTSCPADVLMQVMLAWKEQEVNSSHVNNNNNCCNNTIREIRESVSDAINIEANGKDDVHVNMSHKCKKRSASQSPRLIIKPLAMRCDFSYDSQYDFRRNVTGVAKFVPNAPNWGPKRRHQGIKSK